MTKTQLRQLKKATQKLTRWESSGKAFGQYKMLESTANSNKGADKLYEFFCLMKILEDLQHNYDVALDPGTLTGKIFPQSPANKHGWPFFQIQNKTNHSESYQVCYGTNIKLSTAPQTTIAPDISVQSKHSTDDPDETMVELIMDAKFKYDDDKALSIEQIHAFMQRVAALQTVGAPMLSLVLHHLTGIKSNCLLTNGRGLAKQGQYCRNNGVKQVAEFDCDGRVMQVIG
jgi:hypothetical protein